MELLRRALGIAALLGFCCSPSLAQDIDGDGVADLLDNCVEVSNPSQENADHDRFGNACDGDLDQNGLVDTVDRDLLSGEIGSSRPRRLADLDGDGDVDAADLDWFDQRLAGAPPGPAGGRAHDEDGDGLLDFCARSPYRLCMEACSDGFPSCHSACDETGLPFTDRRDPTLQPDLLAGRGSLEGPSPLGWTERHPLYFVYTEEVGAAGPGAVQWLAWGGAGHGGPGSCRSSCVSPGRLPVSPAETYAYSFYTCTAEQPPVTLTLVFDEYDAAGELAGTVGALNSQKIMSSGPGRWEENLYYYRPSSDRVAAVEPKLARKSGPSWTRGTIWADDFAFWSLGPEGIRTRREPPTPKTPFAGARTRVDELGNIDLFVDGASQPFFPIGIYADWRQDFSVYSDAGFNVVMNERGFGVEAEPGIDAVSPFNPDGMRFMFLSHSWAERNAGGLTLDQALDNLRTKTTPERGIRLWDHLFAFNYDNEIFSRCGDTDEATGECLMRMWEAQRDPLARIFAADRAENGGTRGVPSYLLNGNPGVARAYADPSSAVNAEGDVRCDMTGTYGGADLLELERSEGQRAPPTTAQIQTSAGRRYRPLAWAGIAQGAKMIGTWRDWAATTPGHGALYKAPNLDLCGAEDFGLRARENYFSPPGQIVEGVTSGAQAEILRGPAAWSCSAGGPGASYDVHLVRGSFELGEGLRDAATGDPISGAAVDGLRESLLVDYEITVTQRSWYPEIPRLRREIEALLPVIRASHRTAWRATGRAEVGVGQIVPFGDGGVVWGTRTLDGEPYLILANTHHEIDPYAPWDAQITSDPLRVEVVLDGLGGGGRLARPFDWDELAFTDEGAPNITDGRFETTLPAFGVAVFRLEVEPPSEASGVAEGMAPMLVERGETDETVTLRYDPACRASNHAVLSGPLDRVAARAWDRIDCGLGTSGRAVAEVGTGSRFWIVAGRNAVVEGSAGLDSDGRQRPAPEETLSCALPRRIGARCP